MRISQLAEATGTSARALRHYEERGLVVPPRDSNGYRAYAESDIVRVMQIRTMIEAGLGTVTVRRYLDCARSSEHGSLQLEMCPDLRADLDSLARTLADKQVRLAQTQQRLRRLGGESDDLEVLDCWVRQ